ncbi:C2 family cysteine protease [Cellvibrio sp. OA-2007]|uniref:C2 family cysteine protease n=1 Tax=Cellvibrio sp. OA-2007 TaxID=529823 RepID=UPI000781BDDB|nr:C2 family cysteine protease [Cellvibrio sp. OA-2007]
MELNIGVTNPYAIAEQVAGKQIRWSTFANPVAELSSILQIPEAKIFAKDSPLLRPGVVTDAQGKMKVLSLAEANNRLATFLSSNLLTQPAIRRTNLTALTESRTKVLADSLIQPVVGAANTPWQPANTAWVDKGDFFEDLGEINDPIQGSIANCYFIAAMSSVAWSRPYAIANVVRPSAWGDDESPIHRVTFFKNGTGSGESVEVGERVPVVQGSNSWRYARSRDVGETWPAILEKAFAKWKTGNTTDFPDYGPMAYGNAVLACAEIVRGAQNYRNNSEHSADALIQSVRANSLGGRTFNPMVAWTHGESPAGTDYGSARVVGNHAYSILGWAWSNNTYYIVLRNPWGTHEATLDVLPGNWSSTNVYSAQMPLNTDGVFAMKIGTFKQYFAGLGWVA